MTEVKPFIRCVDYWPIRLTPEILAAYKTMIEKGQITRQHVIFNKTAGSTTVEYLSTMPHEWVREEMKELVRKEMEEG